MKHMWLLEAFLALSLIPAVLGSSLYLAFVLLSNLHQGLRSVAVSAGIGLAGWVILTLQLIVVPMIRCSHGCNANGQLSIGFGAYIAAAATLAAAVWWHQRSRKRAEPTAAHGMHAER